MNSAREGPVLRRSWNMVRGRGEVRSVADGSGAAVAKVWDKIWGVHCGLQVIGEERRHCSLVNFEAISIRTTGDTYITGSEKVIKFMEGLFDVSLGFLVGEVFPPGSLDTCI